MSEINKEHIKRIWQGLEYLTGEIATIKMLLKELKEIEQCVNVNIVRKKLT